MIKAGIRPSVSTHSRLKAAGTILILTLQAGICFNTQPPEGGWQVQQFFMAFHRAVSTHSRLKAAGNFACFVYFQFVKVSTHSRLKAAGFALGRYRYRHRQFQHTAA